MLNLCKTATLKKTEIGFQDQLLLNAGQKDCRMLQGILQYFWPSLSYQLRYLFFLFFEWQFYTSFTVYISYLSKYYLIPVNSH